MEYRASQPSFLLGEKRLSWGVPLPAPAGPLAGGERSSYVVVRQHEKHLIGMTANGGFPGPTSLYAVAYVAYLRAQNLLV